MPGILQLLRAEGLLLQQNIKSQKRALEALSVPLAAGLAPMETRTMLDLLNAREHLGSTGLGDGVAIPHCRVDEATQSSAAILTLCDGVDFGAADGKPVDVFIGLAVPSGAEETHLQYLQELTKILSSPACLKALRSCREPQPLLEVLAEV